MKNIINLDILKPEENIIILNGKKIDVSFIPCGIVFQIDDLVTKLNLITAESIEKDISKAKEAYDLGIELCYTFCQHLYPELDLEYFSKKITVHQLRAVIDAIKIALVNSYKGIEEGSKN
ncbi:MAG: hypothetical protein WC895_04160 [Candidatus Shapirobacteria bacterium]|jgi:hypothetical protein